MSRLIFRLRDIEIDPARGVLTRFGREQPLRPKTFQLLLHLLQCRDRVVTKEELFDALWRDTNVTDDALVQCIGEIRKAVGDDPRAPWFVRTVPKVGYRLIAPIEDVGASVTPPRRRSRRLANLAASVIAILVAASMSRAPAGTARASIASTTDRMDAYRYYDLGLAAAQDLHNQEAIALFERAIAIAPDFAMAHARLGYVYAVSWTHPERAKPYLERALQFTAQLDARERLHILAWRSIAERDYAKAIDYYRLLVTRFPTDVEGWNRLARLLQGEQRLDEAAEALERALILEPRSPALLNAIGGIESARGHHAAAIAYHRKFVSLRPKEPNAWDSLGLSHHAAGQYAEALDAYDRALALNPRFEIAVVHRANTLWELGRDRAAIAQYERYIALAPSRTERQRGCTELFMIYRALGDDANTRIAAQRLADAGANPSWVEPILALDRGDTKRARDLIARLDWRNASRGVRGSMRFWYALQSELALREGDSEQAIAHARAAMGYEAPMYLLETYVDLYPDVLARTGHLRDAVAEYRRVLTVNPSRARTRTKLARTLDALGQHDQATAEYDRVLALWKDADAEERACVSRRGAACARAAFAPAQTLESARRDTAR